jgi:methyl-accepting chemotaxis protein
MHGAILEGLSHVDAIGWAILASTVATLVIALGLSLVAHARYGALMGDLSRNGAGPTKFSHDVLNRILRDARDAAEVSKEPNVQAILEDSFQSELKPLLLAERFVRSATGLVIILGLLGTFYGLTSSIGRLIQLVSSDPGDVTDVTQAVTHGLTHAMSGMAVAFSNSLFGIGSAVVLTVVGVFFNVTDRRTALLVQMELFLEGVLSQASTASGRGARVDRLEHTVAAFDASVARLEGAVSQFDGALQVFAGSTRDFREFNMHLKDNVQRMSLAFGDLSESLKAELGTLRDGRRR